MANKNQKTQKPLKAELADANEKFDKVISPKAGEIIKSAGKSLEQLSKMADKITSVGKASASKAPSTAKLAGELSNLDFRTMIGGPLQAAIDAQIASSMAAVDFINKVGFIGEGENKKLVYVDFSHESSQYVVKEGETTPTKETTIKKMQVPFLAMLQIPSLRIEYVDINFKAKLNSVETSEVKSSLGVNVEAKGGWGPVSMKVSASYQRQSTSGVKIEKEFALDVKVKAVQDEMPKGLEMILNAVS